MNSGFGSDIAFFNSIREMQEQKKRKAAEMQLKRDSYLYDVNKVSGDVAARTATLLPEGAKVKKAEFGGQAPHMAVSEAFGKDDPLRDVGDEVMGFVSSLAGKNIKQNFTNEQLVDAAFMASVGSRLEESYAHTLKEDTSIFGKPAGKAPGYDEFKEEFDSQEIDTGKVLHGFTPEGIAENLGIAAGFNVVAEGIGRLARPLVKKGVTNAGVRALASAAGRGLFGLPAPGTAGFATKLAGLALSTAAGFGAFEAASELTRESNWGRAREDEPLKVLGAELLVGGAGAIAGEKLASKFIMKPIAKKVQTYAEQKLLSEEAGKILSETGTVQSLVDYNKALEVLGKTKKVLQSDIDNFVAKNKDAVKELHNRKLAESMSPISVGPMNKVPFADWDTHFWKNTREPFVLFSEQEAKTTLAKDPYYAERMLQESYSPEVPVKKVTLEERKTKWDSEAEEFKKYFGEENLVQKEYNPVTNVVDNTPLLGNSRAGQKLLPGSVTEVQKDGLTLRQKAHIKLFMDANPGARLTKPLEMGEIGPPNLPKERLDAIYKFMEKNPTEEIPESLLSNEEVFGMLVKDRVPLLSGGNRGHLLLPYNVEKQMGFDMPLRSRVALSQFYKHHKNANAVANAVELGEFTGADLQSAIARWSANNPNARRVPDTIFGKYKDVPEVKNLLNQVLTREQASLESFFTKATDYGIKGKSWKQNFYELDSAGMEEVAEMAAQNIPPEIATTTAAIKSSARKVRKTPAKDGERNRKIAVAAKAEAESVKKNQEVVKNVIVRKGTPLTAKETKAVMENGADFALRTAPVVSEETTASRLEMLTKLAKRKAKETKITKLAAEEPEFHSGVDEFLADRLNDSSVADLIKKGLLIVPIVGVVSLGGTEEADASWQGEAAIGAINVAKEATGLTGKELAKKIIDLGYVGVKGDTPGVVAKWMEGVSVKPTLASVKQSTSSIPKFIRENIMTPGAVGDIFYSPSNNPFVELAHRMSAVYTNQKMHTQAVKEILDMVPGYKNATKEIAEATKPLVEKYEEPMALAGYYEGMMKQYAKDIKNAKDPEVKTFYQDVLNKTRQDFIETKKKLKSYETDWTSTMQQVSAQHPSARIALAIEDTADFKFYPWLKPLMNADELAAVSMLKDLNEVTKGRIIAAGGKVMTSRPFMHHAIHPNSNRKKLQEAFGNVTNNVGEALNLARLHSRELGSRMMIPDVEYAYEKYIPDMERRLQFMSFWKKGQKGGWDEHVKSLRKTGMMTKDLDSMWKELNKSLVAPEQHALSEWANRYYAMESLWRLFLSPSVGFKHLMKQTGNMAIFPTDTWAKGVTGAPNTLKNVYVADMAERFPKAFGDRKVTLTEKEQLVKAFTTQGKYNSAIREMDMFDAPINAFDVALEKANAVGSTIVGGVEAFDRAATVLMGLDMAAKKGLTPSQATMALFDSILKANFLSGVHNPKWVRDRMARAFFMFQGTPFKLLEQRLIMASKAGKDLKKAFGVTLEELKKLKSDMKEGEKAVKWGLIRDAMFETKDVYGQSVTKQFMVNMLTMGGLIWAGDKFLDADIHDQVFHIPFVKMGGESPGVMLNPVLSAGYRTWSHRNDEDRDLLFTEFINKWSGGSGLVPTTIMKAMRLTEDDIPEIYRNSKLRYLFAVPAAKE